MKTAKELYEFSKSQTTLLVAKLLYGVREHIIERCEEEAGKGSTNYSIQLKKEYAFIKDELLTECIKLVKEFEDNGYKVSIDDSGNGYYVNFSIKVSWNGLSVPLNKYVHCSEMRLYDTDIGRIL